MSRPHSNEMLKSGLANSGRIAGIGILYDDYSEDSCPDIHRGTGTPIGKPRTKEELDFIQNGGEVKVYKMRDERSIDR